MNAKTAKQIEDIRSQKFGVEVEMNHIRRDTAAKLAADFFGTGRWEDTAGEDGYYTFSAWDAKGRKWKFSRDSSIEGPNAERCEMITPILEYEDMDLLCELCRQLRHAGAVSRPSIGAGVHCHVDGEGHTPQTLRNLANIMASHEDLLIDALKLDRYRINHYCKTVDPVFLRELNKKKPKTMEELSNLWYRTQNATLDRNFHYNESRYHMLNLHSFFQHHNIEFRLFQFDEPTKKRKGGIHGGQLKSYIQLCLAMSTAAKTMKTASPRPQQNENPKYAMRTWLLRLGFIGDEFATARDILTRNLEGDTAFRHGRGKDGGSAA